MTTEPLAFQDLILTLHKYWGDQGCAILQPYDIEVGAGTLHPATVLRALNLNVRRQDLRICDSRDINQLNALAKCWQRPIFMWCHCGQVSVLSACRQRPTASWLRDALWWQLLTLELK